MADFGWAIYADDFDGNECVIEVFSRRRSALRWMNAHMHEITPHWGGRKPKVLPYGRSYDWVLSGGKIAGRGHSRPELEVSYLNVLSGDSLYNLHYGLHTSITAAYLNSGRRVVESLLTENTYYRANGAWVCLRGRTWAQVRQAVMATA